MLANGVGGLGALVWKHLSQLHASGAPLGAWFEHQLQRERGNRRYAGAGARLSSAPGDYESIRSPGGEAATGSAGILPARRPKAASWTGQKRIRYCEFQVNKQRLAPWPARCPYPGAASQRRAAACPASLVRQFLSTTILPGLSFRPPSLSRQRARSSTMHPLPLLEGEPRSCAIRSVCFRQSP